MDAADSIHTSERSAKWESRAPTPSLRKEPEPVEVELALPPKEDTPKPGLNETLDLLTRVLGARDEDPDVRIFPCWSSQISFSNDLVKILN